MNFLDPIDGSIYNHQNVIQIYNKMKKVSKCLITSRRNCAEGSSLDHLLQLSLALTHNMKAEPEHSWSAG